MLPSLHGSLYFTMGAPYVRRCRAGSVPQIHDATSAMLEAAVPNVVEKLTSLPQDVQKTLHLDVELHR